MLQSLSSLKMLEKIAFSGPKTAVFRAATPLSMPALHSAKAK
jgi:hypothetical protein